MKYFITGSTGFIGMALTKRLVAEGNSIHLLVRSPQKAKELQLTGVTIFEGDILDVASIEAAMQGCTYVFHLAGYAKPTAKDPRVFHEVNVEGTRNVLKAALKLGIKRVVFTSTAGTFGPTDHIFDVNEESTRPERYYTLYAETKRAAELLCQVYQGKGLDVITVFPTRVFGPGVLNESNSLTKIAEKYQKGSWRIIPGNGKTFGNYVFVDDVVNGLILAMDKSMPGENFILGGHNATFKELFQTIRHASGKNYLFFYVPYLFLWLSSALLGVGGFLIRKPALITPSWVKRYLQHRRLSSEKAQKEIGYTITPLLQGFMKTYAWLNNEKEEITACPTSYYTLITGASSGIGKALAIECAKRGMNLLLISLPDTGLSTASEEIQKRYSVDCRFLEIDLLAKDSHKQVFDFAKKNDLKVNVLINNVGVGYNGRFDVMPEQKVTNMLQLNIITTTLLTQVFLPELQKAPRAHILNLGSLGSFSPLPGKSVYAASKAYILYLTKALRHELNGSKITVSAVFPAGVPTNQVVASRIKKSGRVGRSLSSTAEEVARCSIDGMLKGKGIIFPGKKLKSFYFSAGLMPQGLLLYLSYREFKRSPDE
ncbi:MAG: SDR family NAD(P)-dependent oxidoreductase [Bacteroidales bacterium]|nr:SDR family NAD(P)-dependent oxidoreductase [Bacteroidales bacterium]